MKRVYLFLSLILISTLSFSQFNLSGKVINESGLPLEGANIQITDINKGAVADSEGQFEFKNLSKKNYNIQVSFIGYKTHSSNIDVTENKEVIITLVKASEIIDVIQIDALRAQDNTPVTYTMLEKDDIEDQNNAQDIPYILSMTPSAVASSDAGAGVGYSSISIRGSGAKRINVTVDGVPINDPESHSVYWVNMPDLLSSVDNIQVQRGVGTSTNGVGAFGASINFKTETPKKEAYATVSSAVGSYNTYKNNIITGTGLINNKFSIDTRFSDVRSDGYVDRATSSLRSYYLSGAYYGAKTTIRARLISGHERTYQAWNGVPKVKLENDEEGMQRYLDHWLYDQDEYDNMINSDARTYNFYTYKNEVDNYDQNHLHLSISHEITKSLAANLTFHYTKGEGYYENFKKDRDFVDYQLDNLIINEDTITSTNLIQQKWLDNDFYGLTYALNYKTKSTTYTLGGAANKYIGDHFGNVIWAQYASNSDMDYEWYRNQGTKTDINTFGKVNIQLTREIALFTDIQFRHISYSVDGIHDDLEDISMSKDYNFLNPKLGIGFEPNSNIKSYFSVAIANREPSRRNYVDAKDGKLPTPERLTDFELGTTYNNTKLMVGTNLYYMLYKDQLVLTGEINNVGDAILTNVDESYRAGIELFAGYQVNEKLDINMNATFSRNKIIDFTEFVDNWDTWSQDQTNLGTTDLAFSPNFIFSGIISYEPIKNLSIDLTGKAVGDQFIDNTSNSERMLDDYFISNLRISYKFKSKLFSDIKLYFNVNNILNEEYESYAWVYRYKLGGEHYTMDGYFPQAGRNFIAGVSIGF